MKDHMEKETEELSKLLMEWYNKGFSDCQEAAMKAAEDAIDMAILLEREACENICEEYIENNGDQGAGTALVIRDAIRARSNE
jgi:hypothetical protein